MSAKKKRMCIISGLIVMVLCLILFCRWVNLGNDTKPEEVLTEIFVQETGSLLEIEIGAASGKERSASGTGVVYGISDDEIWVITAAHLLEKKADGDLVYIKMGETQIECLRWFSAKERDLAFLCFAIKDVTGNTTFCPVETDKKAYDAMEAGEVVYAKGYCQGEIVQYQGTLCDKWIYTEDFAQYLLLAECEVRHGMSGGGLYDASGRFIGMVCGGNEDGELVAVPLNAIQAEFEIITENETFTEASAENKSEAPTEVPAENKSEAQTEVSTEVPSEETNGYLVVIDAGHQRKGNSEQEPIGPGASETKAKVAGGTKGCVSGLYEYELTLQVSEKLEQELKNRGYEVLMVRTTHDVNISNAQRAMMANDANADAFIRVHANGSENSAVNGVETLCQTDGNPYNADLYEKSRMLSEQVLEGIVNATGASKRQVVETDTMSGINWCQTPVTIVEMGFMTNETEDALMKTTEYQLQIAQGMADGIDAFFTSEFFIQE